MYIYIYTPQVCSRGVTGTNTVSTSCRFDLSWKTLSRAMSSLQQG